MYMYYSYCVSMFTNSLFFLKAIITAQIEETQRKIAEQQLEMVCTCTCSTCIDKLYMFTCSYAGSVKFLSFLSVILRLRNNQ